LQLWLDKAAGELHFVVVPFDRSSPSAFGLARPTLALVIHEGQLTYQNEGLQLCQDSWDLVGL
jgi:predicted solute-binding protein